MKNWSDKKIKIIVWTLTAVVLLLIAAMGYPGFRISVPVDLSFLPIFHSTMNVFVAISLITALVFIKKKDVKNHQKAIYFAMSFSALFLLSYIAYHFTTPPMHFEGEGIVKSIYKGILYSHIALSGLSFPFILFTFIKAYTGKIDEHRKMAKWVFPIWLYVAISGPTVYLMLALFKTS